MPKTLNSDITKLITKYLSIREHSKLELSRKLSDKGYLNNDIDDAIDEFSTKDIQSDMRFTEDFIMSRLKKNKGPRLISAELFARGIPERMIDEKLSMITTDAWHDRAATALQKKLRGGMLSINDKDKIYSFLISRGFEHKMIKCVVDEYKDER
tara:strand:+ start:8654 stop:9115 length:462 start_codon:yes stop_codon:yes gene_type:complete